MMSLRRWSTGRDAENQEDNGPNNTEKKQPPKTARESLLDALWSDIDAKHAREEAAAAAAACSSSPSEERGRSGVVSEGGGAMGGEKADAPFWERHQPPKERKEPMTRLTPAQLRYLRPDPEVTQLLHRLEELLAAAEAEKAKVAAERDAKKATAEAEASSKTAASTAAPKKLPSYAQMISNKRYSNASIDRRVRQWAAAFASYYSVQTLWGRHRWALFGMRRARRDQVGRVTLTASGHRRRYRQPAVDAERAREKLEGLSPELILARCLFRWEILSMAQRRMFHDELSRDDKLVFFEWAAEEPCDDDGPARLRAAERREKEGATKIRKANQQRDAEATADRPLRSPGGRKPKAQQHTPL